ncbi:hypothetical protein EYF80_043760 [Liparis tanakae]|uniref:Uncharacterized protein n=1 Tax=Liparis tanakae TaxID=230148 RepID=A0A4Z2FYI1_9TELE|nr:hypothetical protein EYF80_043760 [Liparis tanakae]
MGKKGPSQLFSDEGEREMQREKNKTRITESHQQLKNKGRRRGGEVARRTERERVERKDENKWVGSGNPTDGNTGI